MKQITLLLVSLFATTFVSAQDAYEHSVSQATYTNLTGATSINGGEVWDWDDFPPVAIPFDFAVDGVEITHFAFFDDNFTLLTEDFDEEEFTGYYDLFAALTYIQDRTYNSGNSTSPLSYKVEGEVGNRILKLEAKNAGLEEDPEADGHYYLNFQIWLYEDDNAIEIRYGNTNVTDIEVLNEDGVFFVGIAGEENAYFLSGESTDPSYGEYTEETFPQEGLTMDAYPAEGTVYRLAPAEVAGTGDFETVAFTVYPNPASDVINLKRNGLTSGEYAIYDVTGKLVKQNTLGSADVAQINIESLTSGVYVLKIDGQNLKFIKS